MKIRSILALSALSLLMWSCDEPVNYENDGFIYNPFTIIEDTLAATSEYSYSRGNLDWGTHLRTLVGNTAYYKAGFSIDLHFPDSNLFLISPDSIQLRLRHVTTYPESPDADTVDVSTVQFGLYEMNEQAVDLAGSVYGDLVGYYDLTVQGTDSYWDINLPPDLIQNGDTTVHLGLFPEDPGFMTFLYGGGSALGPQLSFYYHAQDTAGLDSALAPISFLSDSVIVHLMEQDGMFAEPGYSYLSQLYSDSIIVNFELEQLDVSGDTLVSIATASLEPNVDLASSAIYLLGSADSLFLMELVDTRREASLDISLGSNGLYYANEVRVMVQSALDEDEENLQVVIRPDHRGYDPGFIAIKTDEIVASIVNQRSLAVRP